ncbi:MAG: 16S rRNA (cytosine(967)-C(5))-methyltransferase RsmB [Elusimicrobia bacterium]|nr:16S rRNA (cytosine(967)-C(5))-methyltransferase RsmB [Elusimicrobiota bacterium]
MKNDNPRLLAFQILQKYYPGKTNISNLLNEFFRANEDYQNKGLIREFIWGIVRYLNTIDYFIDSFLDKKNVKNPVRNILRIGVFQLLYLSEKIPSYAAVSETVELTKLSGLSNFTTLVNAILRKIEREKIRLPLPDLEKNRIAFYSIKLSHPEWLISRWINRFGEKGAENLCIFNNINPELTIRTNTLKIARDKLKILLENEGIKSEYTKYSPDGLVLSVKPELETLESFNLGCFVVQDEASQLISYILDPQKNETILDLCSGSGIKSSHIAQLSNLETEIISIDNSPKQIEIAKENLLRLGISNIKFIEEYIQKVKNIKADKILLDTPCSGLGAIRKKPDIKWNRSEKMIKKHYPVIQKELLVNAADLLKKDGIIVYSTCTTEPEENENVVNDFLKKCKNFKLEKIENKIINNDLIDDNGYFFKTYKKNVIMDGFFAAKLKKLN